MKIYCAQHAGFCFGVKRAIKMALDAVAKEKKVYSLGPLIHNRGVVEDLNKKGIFSIKAINEIEGKDSCLIIRSHGIHPGILKDLKNRGFKIIDATCPKVRRAQRYVEKLAREGYYVIIIGEKDHPEIKGLLGYADGKAEIYNEGMEIKSKKVGIVPQTTLDIEHFNEAINKIVPRVVETKIYNTICNETTLRIKEALEIAQKVDLIIVVGGKNSANTTRLYQICCRFKPAYHIESVKELSPDMFRNIKSVGLAAGASTPKEQIRAIVDWLKKRV
ncbi:MAG: 4-hydroxy-3-methylbut-2-enyl diphosphate reductase [candidate division WOR-3 bacterium]